MSKFPLYPIPELIVQTNPEQILGPFPKSIPGIQLVDLFRSKNCFVYFYRISNLCWCTGRHSDTSLSTVEKPWTVKEAQHFFLNHCFTGRQSQKCPYLFFNLVAWEECTTAVYHRNLHYLLPNQGYKFQTELLTPYLQSGQLSEPQSWLFIQDSSHGRMCNSHDEKEICVSDYAITL